MFGFCEMEDEKCESKPQFSSKLSQVYKSSAAYQPGTLTLMQSETFWVSYLFQIPLDLCVYTRNTPKLKKAVGGGTITSPDDIFPQKPIFESNCGVNAPWLAHTARTKQKWNSRFAYLFFFLSCVERMLLLEKLKNNFKKKKIQTHWRTLGQDTDKRPWAYWPLLALHWWPFLFYMVSRSTGPTWQPWMFLGWVGSPDDIHPAPQRRLLGSQLCVLQGPTVSGSPQAGGIIIKYDY